jgi:UPF0755 protein
VRKGVFSTLVALLLLSSAGAFVYWDFDAYMEAAVEPGQDRQVRVVIPQGSTLSHVVGLLEEHELVDRPTYFRMYLIVNDLSDRLKAGVYYFNVSQTPTEIAGDLATGPRVPYVVVTVKEGTTIWQVATALEKAGVAPADEFLELANDEAFAKQAGVPLPRNRTTYYLLEGYVFPETYYIAPGQTLRSVVSRMVKQTFKEIRAAKKRNLEGYARIMEETGFTDYEFLTLASIVERETSLPNEKRLVASVMLNRIKKGWLLQTDPTLTYTPEKKGAKPTPADREDRNNPYNTYQHAGLPPGPICNPGRESLDGVFAPARTRFLYFVAKADGTGGHFFSTNLNDHEAAIKRYLGSKQGEEKKK